jgi:hypothetical protein
LSEPSEGIRFRLPTIEKFIEALDFTGLVGSYTAGVAVDPENTPVKGLSQWRSSALLELVSAAASIGMTKKAKKVAVGQGERATFYQ